jgi:hypothetical protein
VGRRSAWLLGVRISPEEFGNIHYGYVGRYAGIPLDVLLAGGVFANGANTNLGHELLDDGPAIARGFWLTSLLGFQLDKSSGADRWVLK